MRRALWVVAALLAIVGVALAAAKQRRDRCSVDAILGGSFGSGRVDAVQADLWSHAGQHRRRGDERAAARFGRRVH